MSNHLAIAAVTAALRQLLSAGVKAVVSTASIKVGPPSTSSTSTPETALNLFLYQVERNPSFRGEDLPSRRSDGSVSKRPQLALDLYYLLSCTGDSSLYEPERILGAAQRLLHTQPVLPRELVRAALDLEIAGDSSHPLVAADLADQVELVRIFPVSLSLDELSRVWSVLLQTSYSLSFTIQASVVFIDADVSATPALPVLSRNLYALPRPGLQIDTVESSLGKNEPVFATSTLVIRGQGYSGGTILVRLGGVDFAPTTTRGAVLTLDLGAIAATDLRAGAVPVIVVRLPLADDGATLPWGFESNAVGVALRPVATVSTTTPPTATELTLDLVPRLGARQRVTLALYNGTTSVAIEVPPRAADADAVTVALTADVTSGTWLYSLVVDGARSVMTSTGGAIDGPAVVIP